MTSLCHRGRWALAVAVIAIALLLFGGSVLAEKAITIRGLLLSADGRPVKDFPLRLSPMLLDGNTPDNDNVFYKIPNWDQHAVYTDANGEFVMTNVIDYPEVKHHKYRIEANGNDPNRTKQPFVRVIHGIDISTATNGEMYVVVKSEPGSALKILAKDAQGRPYTGTLSVVISSGGHAYVRTCDFKEGVHMQGLPAGSGQVKGRVVILSDRTAEQTKQRLMDRGEDVANALSKTVLDLAIVDKYVELLPFRTTTIEVTLPF